MVRRLIAWAVLIALTACSSLRAGPVIVNSDGQWIHQMGIDQPQLTAVLYTSDPGNVICDPNGQPVTFDPYIDTGSSGFVISALTAQGYSSTDPLWGMSFEVPGLGIPIDYDANTPHFTDHGIGGPETGNVTPAYGIKIRNGTPLEGTVDIDWDTFEIVYTPPTYVASEFTDHHSYNMWVRRQDGYGEVQQIDLGDGVIDQTINPLNVAGMPVIINSTLVMDPTTIGVTEDLQFTRMTTSLLPKGSPTPATNMTFNLALRDFVGTAVPGETLPSHANNPVFENVRISGADPNLAAGGNRWLFDTGSGASMISFTRAVQIGLIDGSVYSNWQSFADAFTGPMLPIAGVGNIAEATEAPVMTLGEVAIPDALGNMITWRNVAVLIVDMPQGDPNSPTLDGVFGLNLLLPAMDATDALGPLGDPNSIGANDGYFSMIVFEPTDDAHALLRLNYSPADPLLPGDTNFDGVVDVVDLNNAFNNMGVQGPPGIEGDTNNDGIVDVLDLNNVFNNLGTTLSAGSGSPAPEPAAMSLLALASLALLRRKRR